MGVAPCRWGGDGKEGEFFAGKYNNPSFEEWNMKQRETWRREREREMLLL